MNFTAEPAPSRQLRVIGGNTVPGQAVQAVVELVAQGDENSLGFSLNFDPAILSNPQAALNADAAGAFLTLNTASSERLGVLLALPAGQSFAAGARSLLTLTFNTAPTIAYGTPLTFGDVPIAKEITNVNADALPTSYFDGAVTFAQGFEADVAPRPTGNGNGTITISDFTQVGRFVAGLDAMNGGYNEFQRADCAPRISLGNGMLSVADYTQAGRYAAGLDIITPTGGQVVPNLFGLDGSGESGSKEITRNDLAPTSTRVVDTQSSPGQQVTVSIDADAQGTENGFGFTLNYDPLTLSNPSVAKGLDTQSATLIPNASTPGKIGVVLAMPFGQAVTAGTRQIVTVTFTVGVNAPAGPTPLTFGDAPVIREVSDVNANVLVSDFTDGAVNILGPTAATATVGGRATDIFGTGLPLVRLVLTDAAGRSRTVTTNPFGFFEFNGVEVGGTYVISASSKRYVFRDPVRVLTVEDRIADLEFTGFD